MTAFWIVLTAASAIAGVVAGRLSSKRAPEAEPLWFAPLASEIPFYYKTDPPELAAVMRVQQISMTHGGGITMALQDQSTLFKDYTVVPFSTRQEQQDGSD